MAVSMKACVECGDGPINHEVAYYSLLIDETLRPLVAPGPMLSFSSRLASGVERWLTPHFFNAAVHMGWGKKVAAPDEHTALLAQMLWEEANARGIEVWEFRLFNLPRNLFYAQFPNGTTLTYEGIPEPKKGNFRVWWLDNKAIMKKKFRKLGFPIAQGGSASSAPEALRLYRRLVPPVIVKPYAGSASRHTTLHIDNEQELLRGYKVATQVAPMAVIEEELIGGVYRATVVDGKLAAVLRRDPPRVVGDGVHTIEELVTEENKHPARGGPYFSKITLNDAALQELLWQGYEPTDVPEQGAFVTFHQKINWSVGGTTADVTDSVHPDNVALFEAATKALKTTIVGYDFIIGDMSRSWKEQQRCGFIEANSMPFFDNHHLPFEGEVQNVAGKIWDMVTPE
jgi:D-alanine-D-alanine ligase-like ATP-grasp enzyme